MSFRAKLWITSTLLYALFFGWYTDFGGPLTDQEVDAYVSQRLADGGAPEITAYFEEFFRNDSGRQFLIVNNIDYNENPGPVKGAEPGEDAQQLMGRYMEHMFPALLSRASHPVIMGDTTFTNIDTVGIDNAENWDAGMLFRYRSRRALMEILSNPDLGGKLEFKHAALIKTIAYPIETNLHLGDLRFILGLIFLVLTLLIDNRILSKRNTQ